MTSMLYTPKREIVTRIRALQHILAKKGMAP